MVRTSHDEIEALQHPLDAGQALEGRPEIVGVDQLGDGVQLVQHELEPQLGGLVLDDEQQLVVGVGAGMLGVDSTRRGRGTRA